MSWNYRAMKDGDEGYHVHKVYSNDNGYTAAIKPYGESLDELIEDLERMVSDLKTHGEYYK